MIKNIKFNFNYKLSFIIALIIHVLVFILLRKYTLDQEFKLLNSFRENSSNRINNIELIDQSEFEKIKRVGIANGKKGKHFTPDLMDLRFNPVMKNLNLEKLNNQENVPIPEKDTNKEGPQTTKINSKNINNPLNISSSSESSSFYFNPKKEKIINENREQNILKEEAFSKVTTNNADFLASKMSNFEIRYERPNGVPESELNSDEKAFYSFFKRSYSNYLSKLYATYEKIIIERPSLKKDLDKEHLLIGKIDYDENGNIVKISILKSSESDNVHYFFEETLKELSLPNPPKFFTKMKKKFTTYYQLQIN